MPERNSIWATKVAKLRRESENENPQTEDARPAPDEDRQAPDPEFRPRDRPRQPLRVDNGQASEAGEGAARVAEPATNGPDPARQEKAGREPRPSTGRPSNDPDYDRLLAEREEAQQKARQAFEQAQVSVREAERDRAQRQLTEAQAQVAAAERLVERERGEAQGARKEAEQARDEARRMMEAAERKEAAASDAAKRALWDAEQRTKAGQAEAEQNAAAAREEAQQAREAEQRAQRARLEAEQKADEARAEAEQARKEADKRAERATRAQQEAKQAQEEAEKKAAQAREEAKRVREAKEKAATPRGGALTRTARTIWTRRWALLVVGLLIGGVAVAASGGNDNALYIAAGAGIGLVVALMLGWLLGRSDERLRAVDELEEVYELPVIARIPRSKALGVRRGKGDAFLRTASGQTPEAEAFRGLRTSLRYLSIDRDLRSLAVVSAMPGDGRSTVARCLAVTMAAMGDTVVLVDADMRKPDPKRGDGDSEDGLSLALAGFDLNDALVEIPVASDPISEKSRGLVKLPSGPAPPNPVELLESERMGWVLQELERRFDRVIIDTPAVDGVSDALELVSQVSGVLLVSGVGHTKRGPAAELHKQLDLQDATPVGVVANFSDTKGGEPPRFERSQ